MTCSRALPAEPSSGTISGVTRKQRRSQYYALAIGAVTTVLICGAYLTGRLERIELMTLDWRFRTVSVIPQSPRITCIDIDDGSIDLHGRWPWHRDVQAHLLRLLGELGARAILVDLTWSEAEGRRVRERPYADLLEPPFGDRPDSEAILPDYLLRNAIAGTGQTYLAYHYKPRDLERSPQFRAAFRALQRGDEAAARAALDELVALRSAWPIRDEAPPQPDEWLQRARLTAALAADPEARPGALAASADFGADLVERYYLRCLRAALRARIDDWIEADPSRRTGDHAALIPQLYAELTERPFADDTSLKEALLISYREALSAEATTRGALPLRPQAAPFAAPVEGVVPVYYLHARAAADCGFVVFEPDVDGVMRRMRLLVRSDGRMLVQLAFQVACEVLEADPADLRWERNAIVIPSPHGDRRLQLDAEGRVLVPWVAPPPAATEEDSSSFVRLFKHLPAARLLDLARLDQRAAENERVIRDTLERVCAADVLPGADAYVEQLTAWKALSRARDRAVLERRSFPAEGAADLRALREALDRHERETLAFIPETLRELEQVKPEEMSDQQFVLSGMLPALQQALGEVQRQRAVNERIAADLAQRRAALATQLQGQVCLIGYTATSLADMAPLPTDKRAPGVSAHANLINALLVDRSLGWTGPAVNVVLTLLCGLVISLLCALRSSRESVVYTVAALLAIIVFGYWLPFRYADLWVTVTPPILAVVLSFAAISAFFYIFVDRQRRQLSTALGQYTSQAIARQVADDPELCQRAEVREVTSIFTDLKGFTSISERIGAARTQAVLNACLGTFTEVMLRHDAMVNKFMGDGIFAFWNPVINPQDDHARRACETALDLLVALQALKHEHADGGEDAFADLFLRVGIATGKAVVGPCGSDQKWDYTCIGDAVNLAARLESANKAFGTRILVGGLARERVGDRFRFRSIGRVQVKGKTEGVPVFELLGRADEVSAERQAYADRFGQAVERFQARDWQQAGEAFEACRAAAPADAAAELYLETIAQWRRDPPPADWNGAVELKEK